MTVQNLRATCASRLRQHPMVRNGSILMLFETNLVFMLFALILFGNHQNIPPWYFINIVCKQQ